jgi:hypothetical protein
MLARLTNPIVALFLLVALAAGPAAAQQAGAGAALQTAAPQNVAEAVAVRHLGATNAVAILTPMASPTGHIHANQEVQVLTLVDTRERVDRMLELLAQLDRPRAQLEVTCFVIVAGESSPVAGMMPFDEVRAVMTELRRTLAYEEYHLAERGAIRLTAGDVGELLLGGKAGWRLSLNSAVRYANDDSYGLTISVHREAGEHSGGEPTGTVVFTTIEMTDGQTAAVGVSSLEDGRALVTLLRLRVLTPQ